MMVGDNKPDHKPAGDKQAEHTLEADTLVEHISEDRIQAPEEHRSALPASAVRNWASPAKAEDK
jgi:hypothetical protein